MTFWITIYNRTGKKWSSSAERLNPAQFAEMDYMFRSACLGLDSPDIRKIHEQHRKSTLFYHLSDETGLRYRIEINKRRGTALICSVDADHTKIAPPDKGSRGKKAA